MSDPHQPGQDPCASLFVGAPTIARHDGWCAIRARAAVCGLVKGIVVLRVQTTRPTAGWIACRWRRRLSEYARKRTHGNDMFAVCGIGTKGHSRSARKRLTDAQEVHRLAALAY